MRKISLKDPSVRIHVDGVYRYAVRGLRYSEVAAQRRIASMRMLKELPELEEKLKTGEIKVTQVAQVQSFLRAEKGSGKSYSLEQKRELLQSTVGKSTRETEKLLVEKSPAYAQRAGPLKEHVREISASLSHVSFVADESLIQQLNQIRDRFAQRLPQNATPGDVIRFMAKFVLENDPMLRKTRKEIQRENQSSMGSNAVNENQNGTESNAGSNAGDPAGSNTENEKLKITESSSSSATASLILPPAPEVVRTARSDLSPIGDPIQSVRISHPRTPPRSVLRRIWRRDYPAGCTATYGGKRCGSRRRLQADHYPIPYALGGSSTDPSNLRLVCFQCNQLAAQKIFGRFRS